jgi:hypothetical protein
MTSKKIKIVSFEGGGDDMDALLKNMYHLLRNPEK